MSVKIATKRYKGLDLGAEPSLEVKNETAYIPHCRLIT